MMFHERGSKKIEVNTANLMGPSGRGHSFSQFKGTYSMSEARWFYLDPIELDFLPFQSVAMSNVGRETLN